MKLRYLKYYCLSLIICLLASVVPVLGDNLEAQSQPAFAEQAIPGALNLQGLLAEAIEKNAEVKSFSESVASAGAGVISAKTWDNPQLAVGPGLKHVPGSSTESGTTFFKENVELTQLILFPGKRSLQIAIAQKDLSSSELALEGLRYQVTFKAKKLFYEQLALKEITKLREKQVQSTRTFAESARKKANSGYGSDFEVVKSEAELISAKKLLRESQAEMATNEIALNTLLGRPTAAVLKIVGRLEDFKPTIIASTNIDFAISQNPAYRAQMIRLEKAGLSVKATKLSRAPDLSVGPFIEYGRDERIYGLGVSLPLPLWDTKQGPIELASAEKRKEIAETEKLRLEIAQAVATALENVNASREARELYTQEFLARLKRAMEQAEKSYATNATTLLIYLDAKRTYFDSLADYYASQAKVVSAYTELESAVGVPLDQK